MRLLAALFLLATCCLAGHEIRTVDDIGLRKDMPCRVTYPVGRAKAPVLVFSHGLYGSKDAYQPLTRFYASHGYVVLQPTHPDSAKFGFKRHQKATRIAWRKRPEQVKLLLDSFARIEKLVPDLKGRLDAERIAMAGHSFGAHTSQLVAGVTVLGRSFRDERLRAVVCLSPQGPGGALREESWKGLGDRPVLFVTGSKDESPLQKGKGGEWRRKAYELAPPGNKYLVWIEGADHTLGGISGRRGDNPKHMDIVKKSTLAFLDAYVRDDKEAKAYLAADGPAAEGVVFKRK